MKHKSHHHEKAMSHLEKVKHHHQKAMEHMMKAKHEAKREHHKAKKK